MEDLGTMIATMEHTKGPFDKIFDYCRQFIFDVLLCYFVQNCLKNYCASGDFVFFLSYKVGSLDFIVSISTTTKYKNFINV